MVTTLSVLFWSRIRSPAIFTLPDIVSEVPIGTVVGGRIQTPDTHVAPCTGCDVLHGSGGSGGVDIGGKVEGIDGAGGGGGGGGSVLGGAVRGGERDIEGVGVGVVGTGGVVLGGGGVVGGGVVVGAGVGEQMPFSWPTSFQQTLPLMTVQDAPFRQYTVWPPPPSPSK